MQNNKYGLLEVEYVPGVVLRVWVDLGLGIGLAGNRFIAVLF